MSKDRVWNPDMDTMEYESWKRGDIIKIGDYVIEAKRDFGEYGFLSNGKWINAGWVVTQRGCNICPGAGWASTLSGAKKIVGALMASKGDPDVFHGLMMLTRDNA